MNDDLRERLRLELDQAEAKAWDSLARYKFQMFGYWAAIWVHTNRTGDFLRPNPFKALVQEARKEVQEARENQAPPFDLLWRQDDRSPS